MRMGWQVETGLSYASIPVCLRTCTLVRDYKHGRTEVAGHHFDKRYKNSRKGAGHFLFFAKLCLPLRRLPDCERGVVFTVSQLLHVFTERMKHLQRTHTHIHTHTFG